MKESMFWADQAARRIIKEKGNKKKYVCAAGITPSGTVHIGNCREIFTVDIVARALKDLGKEVRFIYSWDDFDRIRKVPKNIPKQKEMEKYLFKSISEIPDPWGCHKTYAEHFEKNAEEHLPHVGVNPEFIRQSKMYGKCAYSSGIKKVLENMDAIRKILNKFRKEPLEKDWHPVRVYCSKCNKEETKVTDWDGNYALTYECKCGHKETFDFRKNGIAKLQWRVDWPMRWDYEKVDFEPGGKDHSAPGGSYDAGKVILKTVWNRDAPVYLMYDFVTIKGVGGKMSSSLGNVITLADVLKVYTPEVVRFFFAGTKPLKEFYFSFDEDVFKFYEDFYKGERIYYGKEKVPDRDKAHWSRVYEMSLIEKPAKEMPMQPGFRECVTLITKYSDPEKAVKSIPGLNKSNMNRYLAILKRAKFWIENYAPEQHKAILQNSVSKEVLDKLKGKQKKALRDFAKKLDDVKTEEDVKNLCFNVSKDNNINLVDFFKAAYLVLLGNERGPRLAAFIMVIGKEKVKKLLEKI
ncbi:MAG: lysine--tRNA ligase [Nanoarchaeota archaeon]